MKILAFDTSSTACSIALYDSDKKDRSIISIHQNAPMQQAKLILPMIKELLEENFYSINQLDAIAYGCGPGSFTGIRLANSVAQGLSLGVKLPLIPISSLAAMAKAAMLEHHWTHLLVALDARMEEIYWAAYQINAERADLIMPEKVYNPQEIVFPETLRDQIDWYGIGDGWEKYGEVLTMRLGFKPKAIYASQLPTAEAIVKLAIPLFQNGQWVRASCATPVYLR